ncbi:serpin family protein [Amycolatopsis acidicola]|uniref:Serpin family protein n=1 Tax=Amycolatopsis acidicola TaxID=2596893 RepID=A0A5N0V400_9PSEU|nr:serpin family protein [Amycolatopsis acidicola]KAA9159815.1 serpin family protein [Amycolatopsis acidicola]
MTKPKPRGPERDHLRFCFALHRAVSGKGDSCFSPYSVASALGLTSQAAAGETARELVGLLAGTDADVTKQAELLRAAATLEQPAHREPPVLEVSNTLWAAEDLPLNEDFLGQLAAWPNGGVKPAPFGTDPDGARRAINADVAETTRDLIPELLQPGSVGADTVASLVNALYLKVAWLHPFSEHSTKPADFHSPSGTRRVPMMHLSERLSYAAHDGWQLVELPGVGEANALVLLPDKDLADAESTLDEDGLAKLLSVKAQRQVRLSMPKVDLEMRAELKPALAGLGVRSMFRPDADFTPLTPDERLCVDDVVHQSVLRVGEQGFEGAAATAVTMRLAAMIGGDPVDLVLDRPFLLLVRHAPTGVVYFFARVVEP